MACDQISRVDNLELMVVTRIARNIRLSSAFWWRSTQWLLITSPIGDTYAAKIRGPTTELWAVPEVIDRTQLICLDLSRLSVVHYRLLYRSKGCPVFAEVRFRWSGQNGKPIAVDWSSQLQVAVLIWRVPIFRWFMMAYSEVWEVVDGHWFFETWLFMSRSTREVLYNNGINRNVMVRFKM